MLKVKTLGGFQIFWEEKQVSLGKQTNNNIMLFRTLDDAAIGTLYETV